MLKVVKFGGSSVAEAEQFKKVRDIINADSSRKLVVVSAAGKRSSKDHKLTDLLYLCHAHLTYGVSCEEILSEISQRFVEIKESLGLKYDVSAEFAQFTARLNKDSPVDEIVTRGEYFTSKLMAEFLGYTFVDAADCIFFSYDGKLDSERTYAAVKSFYEKFGTIVVPGFYGSLPNGHIKVMSRGGSDITGAIVAAAVNADVYENWTDVSGILMADPRIVSSPSPIQEITYAELREMAYMGANVLHEDSILPVKEKNIPVNIRNTNRPEDAGTFIVENGSNDAEEDRFITGIAGRKNFDIITVHKRNMDNNSALRASLEIFDRFHIAVEHITIGLDTFAFIVSSAALGDSVYDIMADIRKVIEPDNIEVQDNISLVAAIGRKMMYRPGTSGRLFQALGQSRINVRTIAQGADELSIIIGVDNSQFDETIRILYNAFAG